MWTDLPWTLRTASPSESEWYRAFRRTALRPPLIKTPLSKLT